MHVREVAELIPIHLTQGRDLLLYMPFLPVFISIYSLPPLSPLPSFLVELYWYSLMK